MTDEENTLQTENGEYTPQEGTGTVEMQGLGTAKDIVTNSSQQIFDNFVNRNFDKNQQE